MKFPVALKYTFCFVVQLLVGSLYAADTLKITIPSADSMFLKNNFELLAASMNIEAEKARVIQAKLYPNPLFTAEVNALNPQRKKYFDVGTNGQKSFQLEQLILLGGKRKSEIEIAKTNAAIAELEFASLVRQLKFSLHYNLFAGGQQFYLLQKYNQQLELINTLLAAYQEQADKGNLPLKEVVRLKGAYLKLNNDRANLLQDYFETQKNLQTLLQTSAVIRFQFTEQDVAKYIQDQSEQNLQAEALKNRPELLIIQQNKTLAEQYLAYQKRLAIPDVNLFTSYDQRGGAFTNQVDAGIAIPLPLLNRNQGNIRASQYKIKEAEYQLQAMQSEIVIGIQNSYQVYNQLVAEYKKALSLYNSDFELTVKGMTDNFQKRNVSIVEFIDFFEAYNEVLTELTRIKIQLVTAAERINLLTGKDIY